MKGEDRYLSQLLEGSKTRFIIPVYQRNYDWTLDNCKQLFEDLLDLIKEGGDSHFFGSIVSKAEGDARIIIDGQQRITTSYLLLMALVSEIKNKDIEKEDKDIDERITEEYLIDKWHKEDSKLKLKLIKDDQAAFEAIYNGDEIKFIESSKVTQNYRFFLEQIKNSGLTADELLDAIEKLMIIDIKLQTDDDPQRIFESLNSTGLDLSEGDKIRNFILMGLDPKTQEDYYENYWNEIEKNTDFNVSDYIRDYLSCVLRRITNKNNIYKTFKDFVKDNDYDTRELLDNLLKFSGYYHMLSTASTGKEGIDSVLKRFNLMDRSITTPFLLNVFDFWFKKKIDDKDLEEIIEVIENYIFRRWVCLVPTGVLNKIFVTLHSEVEKGVNEGGRYSEVLKKILLTKDVNGRYPRDEEFVNAIKERDFYQVRNYKYYIYDRLENGNSREKLNVVDNLKDETYTVEHVMPQTLDTRWIESLGPNYKEIHEKWMNNIANLTFTAYNSQYSNRPFKEKKTIKNGFNDTNFRINRFIVSCDKWTEDELMARQEILIKQFLELWPMIDSDFEWAKPTYDSFDLDDIDDFTGKKIAGFTFMDKNFEVETWAQMVCAVLYMIQTAYPGCLQKYISYEDQFPGRLFFSHETENTNKIVDGLFYDAATSTRTKIETLRTIFNDLGLDQNSLIFDLLPEDDVK